MSKIVTLTAGAIGFVLGSRAGREPYEKLSARAGQVRRDPRVQEKVGQAQQAAQDKAKEAASAVGGKVSEKVNEHKSSSTGGSGVDTDPSTPSSETVGQAGPGPQGDLP